MSTVHSPCFFLFLVCFYHIKPIHRIDRVHFHQLWDTAQGLKLCHLCSFTGLLDKLPLWSHLYPYTSLILFSLVISAFQFGCTTAVCPTGCALSLHYDLGTLLRLFALVVLKQSWRAGSVVWRLCGCICCTESITRKRLQDEKTDEQGHRTTPGFSINSGGWQKEVWLFYNSVPALSLACPILMFDTKVELICSK